MHNGVSNDVTGFDPTEHAESVEAVRAVAVEALERDAAWSDLAAAGLLALPVPEEHGGEGLGLVELAALLREVGRRARHLPVWETLACGALTLAAHGTDAQAKDLLPGVATGETLLSPAIREAGSRLGATPTTTFDDGTVSGRKISVTYADRATRLLVTATDGDRTIVALVDPTGPGVVLEESSCSERGTRHTVVLDGAPAELLDDALDRTAARTLLDIAVAGLAVQAAGVVAGARDLTASYVKGRTQFGRSLAEFQAVAMQIAEVYIVSRLTDLAADNVAWRVSAGLDAADDLAVASYWVCAEGPKALRTCHHLHGGVGVDETYPLHHYFSWITDLTHDLDTLPSDVPVESAASKNLELTQAQRSLKAELRAYFTSLAEQNEERDSVAEGARDRHGETYQRLIRKMGDDGWLGVGWPQEYGGHGLGEIEQTIFANEAQWADVHLPAVTLQTVGPTLIRYGTPAQKEKFLARILAGDVHFAIGYSEPDAGTDLASLRTTARREGDHYVVNGQKLWTTGGHQADFVWLAVRTDTEAPKHRGISILIVDTSDPGYSWTPIITADGSHHVNATYYNDVRVPVDMLVGEENAGWKLITTQLNHERVMLGPAGRIEGLRDKVLAWAREAGVLDRPDVTEALGRVNAVFRVNELLNWEVARAAAQGEISVGDASSSKVFAADQVQHLSADLVRIVHRYGDPSEPRTKALMAYLDAQAKRNLVLTFGGGVQEVQRELIAMFGLGLPRVPR
ncbi:acyl-CoA dehydrogenase [Nocardioides acrostichi]|uniref:Acyl-CoA dehydrogenase n=1 Tax=Nocardioides acrostichi TaxID=2784339 RepID=A0A930Y7L5_9ACTN|nr:acyl-CoA dehydrogenase [Nocardioides acrostichi]MBF4162126.1 acyl-CoA dehydrogenase [Nocardioides acrostichi]